MSFWKQVSGRAFEKTKSDLHLQGWSSVVLGIAIIMVALALLYVFGSPDASWDEFLSRLAPSLLLLLVFPARYVWNFLRLPAVMYGEIVGKIYDLEKRVLPRFELECSPNNAVERLPIGTTVRSVGGKHQTIVKGYDSVIRVLCKNISLSALEDLEAYLVGLYEIGERGQILDIRFRDSLRLSWSRDWKTLSHESDSKSYTKTLPSNAAAHFYVLKQWGAQSVQIPCDQSILELNNIFDNKSPFRAVVQVNAKDSMPTWLTIDVSFETDGRIKAHYSGDALPVPVARSRMLPSLEDKRV